MLPILAAGSVDMILCDLPYGMTGCDWDKIIPLEPLWKEYRRIIKPRGAIVLTASNSQKMPFAAMLIMSNPSCFKHEWIWYKNCGSNFGSVKNQPMKEHEHIIVFGLDTPNYYPIEQERSAGGAARAKYILKPDKNSDGNAYGGFGRKTAKYLDELRCPGSVIRFNREMGDHPTQKPVALMEYFIRTYTLEGDTVLDNAMGSGTTGVACVKTGRNFIGMDNNEKHYKTAKRRITRAEAIRDNRTGLFQKAEGAL